MITQYLQNVCPQLNIKNVCQEDTKNSTFISDGIVCVSFIDIPSGQNSFFLNDKYNRISQVLCREFVAVYL